MLIVPQTDLQYAPDDGFFTGGTSAFAESANSIFERYSKHTPLSRVLRTRYLKASKGASPIGPSLTGKRTPVGIRR